jgi:exosortase H (IPTLxxWG-CTERM-specific)
MTAPKVVGIRGRQSDLRFILTFAALAGALSIVYCFPYQAGTTVDMLLHRYLQVYARLAGALLVPLDRSVQVSGQMLQGRFAIRIARDCDAMEAQILFLAAVMAHDTTWRHKLVGLLAGASAIMLVNVLRVWTMYFAGVYWPSAFEFVHRDLWPMLIVAFAIVAFLRWANWAESARGATECPSQDRESRGEA